MTMPVYAVPIPTGGSDEPPVCYLPVAQAWRPVMVGLIARALEDWYWDGTDEDIEAAEAEVAKWIDYLEECVSMYRDIQGFTFFDCKVTSPGGMGFIVNANQMHGGFWYTLNPVSGESTFFVRALLGAGTYTVELHHVKTNVLGKFRWYMDAVANDSAYDIDMYSAAAAYNQVHSCPIVVANTGLHALHLVNIGKNASSGGYLVTMNGIRLIQTGA